MRHVLLAGIYPKFVEKVFGPMQASGTRISVLSEIRQPLVQVLKRSPSKQAGRQWNKTRDEEKNGAEIGNMTQDWGEPATWALVEGQRANSSFLGVAIMPTMPHNDATHILST